MEKCITTLLPYNMLNIPFTNLITSSATSRSSSSGKVNYVN